MPGTNAAIRDQETASWVGMLDNMQQQNVALKNLLAEIVKHDINGPALERAEGFLNSILNKDAVIALLRRDIADHLKFPENDKDGNRQAKLLEDILRMRTELNKLNTDLLSYLQTVGPFS